MDSSSWMTVEDIKRDLFEYSDLEYPRDNFVPAPPKSIAEYRARTSQVKNPGLFDGDREDIEVFISGRGKYQPDRIIRPGRQVNVVPEDDSIIQKKIREVSGLGYRNEMIEQAFNNKDSYEEEDKFVDMETKKNLMLDLKLLPLGSEKTSATSSRRSSPVMSLSSPDESLLSDLKNLKLDHDNYSKNDNVGKRKCKKKKFKKLTSDMLTSLPSNTKGNWSEHSWEQTHTSLVNFPPLK